MCSDCPTWRDTAQGLLREVTASLLLPLVLYAIPVGAVFLFAYRGI